MDAKKEYCKMAKFLQNNHRTHFVAALLAVFLMLLLPKLSRGQSFQIPHAGNATANISYTTNSNAYHVYDDGGPSSNYSRGCNGSLTITSTDGRPFTLQGSYNINTSHCLTIYDGASTSHPIQGFYSGQGTISIFCASGSVTLHLFSTPSGTRGEGVDFTICYSTFSNVGVRNTNSTYTTLGWNGPSGRKYIRYVQTRDVNQSYHSENGYYPDSINFTALASGTKYAYQINTSSQYSNDCQVPVHYFRTPRIQDCPTCNHNRECIDYTALMGAEGITCYKGNAGYPDSAVCVVDNGQQAESSRHTVNTDTTLFSPYTNNGLRVVPTGDTASVRIGNWNGNREGECIEYELHVDTNDYDLMMLRYACAVTQPLSGAIGHMNPRITIRLLDENCRPVDPLCYSRDLMAMSPENAWDTAAGWHRTPMTGQNCYWRDWTAMAINLSAYHGKTLYLQIATSDGTTDVGAAWAYFTLHCARQQIDHLQTCGTGIENTFYAPDGFRYRWYNADSSDVALSTSRSLHVVDSGLYHCYVYPVDCPDTSCGYVINALASIRHPHAAFDDSIVAAQCQFSVRFVNRSTVNGSHDTPLWTNEDCETAYWDFGNGHTSTNYHAETIYTQPGDYTVMLVSGIAGGLCTDTIYKTLHLRWEHATPYIDGDSNLCPGEPHNYTVLTVHNTINQSWEYTYGGRTYYDPAVAFEFEYDSTQTVTCTVLDSNGCNTTLSRTVVVHPTFNLSEVLTKCQAQMPFSWRGHQFNTQYTSNYTFSDTTIWGCDSITNLRLNVLPSYENNRLVRYCDYVPNYPYADSVYHVLGAHTYVHHLPTGCDSIVHLTLDTIHSPRVHISDSVCQGYPYDNYNFAISAAQNSTVGLHNYDHRNPISLLELTCDSTTFLHLKVNQPTTSVQSITVVQSELPYAFNGVVFDHPVTDTVIHITNIHGCDSAIRFSLFINLNVYTTQEHTICDNELPYLWDGIIFVRDTAIARAYPAHSGADSIVTRILHVNPTFRTDHYDTICSNGSSLFDGHTYTAQGVYVDSLHTARGCDSLEVLHLTVHPVTSAIVMDTVVENQLNYTYNGVLCHGDTAHCMVTISNHWGCDSVIDYNLYVFRNVAVTLDSTICQNSLPFVWNSETFAAAGTKTHTLHQVVGGADSVVTMHLHVNLNTDTTIVEEVLENELPHTFNGHSYSAEVHNTTVRIDNHNGCDSLIHYTLMVHYNQQNSVDSTICASDLPLLWNGITFTHAENRTTTLVAASGADSLLTMRLHVNDTFDHHYPVSICDDTSYLFAGVSYSAAGNYTHHLSTLHGCDSTVTLHLSLRAVTHSTVEESVTENELSHNFNGVLFGSDTSHALVTIANAVGCDSIIDYTLKVWRNVGDTIYDTICDNLLPYTWNTLTFAQAGVQVRHLYTQHGADSLVTHILTVHPTFHFDHPATICSDTSFLFNGHRYSLPGTYTDTFTTIHGCDSLETLHLSVTAVTASTIADTIVENQLPYTFNGAIFSTDAVDSIVTITNIGGCDSIITYSLSVHRNVAASAYDTICQNALPWNWNHRTFAQGGTLLDTLLAHTGADSVLTMHLLVHPNTHSTYFDTCLENELPRHFLQLTSISDTANAVVVIPNANGCDSIIDYSLYVHHNIFTPVDSTVCASSLPLMWNHRTFLAAGTQLDTLPTRFLADSIVSMTLIVHDTFDHHIPDTICDNQSLLFADSTYAAPGVYVHHLHTVHGCDSVATLHLTVHAVTYSADSSIIVENQLPYTYNGRLFSDSVSHTPVTMANVQGCDSIIDYTLKVHWNVFDTARITICDDALPYTWNDSIFLSAGSKNTTLTAHTGADSLLTMILTVNPTRAVPYFDTICNDTTYAFNGHVFSTSGVYQDTFPTIHGCDSVETLHLTVWAVTDSTVFDTIVENQLSHLFNGHLFASDTTNTLVRIGNYHGCDSLITYNLFVHRNVFVSVDSTICENNLPLDWNHRRFSHAGVQLDTLLAHTLADSVVTMTLHVDTNTHSTYFDTCVENQLSRLFNGVSFVSDTTNALVTIPNDRGCDSVIYYNLFVYRNQRVEVDSTLCQNAAPLLWNGKSFSVSGSDTAHFTAIHGEDSLVVMHVVVDTNTHAVLFDTIVQNQLPFQWHNRIFTSAGTLLDTIANIHGCDSLLTLRLFVWMNDTALADSLVCQNFFPFSWNNTIFDSAGSQQVHLLTTHGADSLLTMNVSRLPNTYSSVFDTIVENDLSWSFNGVDFPSDTLHAEVRIPNADGCDSIIDYSLHVHWNVHTAYDSTICDNFLPLAWDLDTFALAGSSQHTLLCVNGADSVVTHRLFVNPTYRIDHYDTICNDATFVFLDSVYASTGIYVHHLHSALGCDSLEVIHLQVNLVTYDTVLEAIVENQLPYDYHGHLFADSISHVSTVFPNVAGCDSIVDYSLHVHWNVFDTIDSTICEGFLPLQWNHRTFLGQGSLQDTLLAHTGADSILTMRLHVLPNSHSIFADTTIENNLPYLYLDSSFFADQLHVPVVTPSANGCDSIVDFSLHVYWNVHLLIDTGACQGNFPFLYAHHVFDSAGFQADTLLTSHGADSIVSIFVAEWPNFFTEAFDTICDYSGVMIQGLEYMGQRHFSTIHLCDSTELFHLWANPVSRVTIHDTVAESQMPVSLYGNTYHEPVNNQQFLFTNRWGCDSIVNFSLSVFPTVSTMVDSTICHNLLPFHWGNVVFSSAGNLNDTLTASYGGDSIVTRRLHIRPNYSVNVYDTSCSNLPFHYFGRVYNQSTVDSANFLAINGCDSLVRLYLTVYPPTESSYSDTIPVGQLPFDFHGHLFSADVADSLILISNAHGCDSLVHYSFHVYYSDTTRLDTTLCQNLLPATIHGLTFFHDTTLVSSHMGNNGVDSILILTLHTWPSYLQVDSISACDFYTWIDSLFYTASTISPTVVYPTIHGCDSVQNLHLSVRHASSATIFDTIDESMLPYHYLGHTFLTDAHDSLIIIPNQDLCDSTIHFYLHVYRSATIHIDTTLCQNALPFDFLGLHFSEPGTQHISHMGNNGVDSIFFVSLSTWPSYQVVDSVAACDNYLWIDGQTYTSSTSSPSFTLPSIHGCDSVSHLHLSLHQSFLHPDVVSACDSLRWIDSLLYRSDTIGPRFATTSIHGCDSILTLHLTLHPSFSFSSSDTICEGTSFSFNGRDLNASGHYEDSLLSAFHCDSLFFLDLRVLQLPLISIDKDYDCDLGQYTVTATTDVDHHLWTSFPDDPFLLGQEHANTIVVRPTTHETYTFFADYLDVPTCPATVDLNLSPLLKPHAAIEATPEFLTVDQLHCDAINRSTNEDDHLWFVNDIEQGHDTRISHFADIHHDSVVFKLVAYHGVCSDSAVHVIPFRRATVYSANTFTPGEETNNIFYVRGDGIIDYDVTIYTRGGDFVWHTTDLNQGWDGKKNGVDCPQGTYVYIVFYHDVTMPNTKKKFVGTVTLLR